MEFSEDVELGLKMLASSIITDAGATALIQGAFAVLTKKLDESAIYGTSTILLRMTRGKENKNVETRETTQHM